MSRRLFLLICQVGLSWPGAGNAEQAATPCRSRAQIVVGADAPELERYAAKELQRYCYALSGELFPIVTDGTPIRAPSFVVGQVTTNKRIADLVKGGMLNVGPRDPGEQGYVLKRLSSEGHDIIVVAGSDAIGTLYGVYGLLDDHYSIGFYLDGDVLPETKARIAMVAVDERKKPRQSVRGILPWTNFFQSATVYSLRDFKYVIDQMARMRLNLLNLHNYNGAGGHQEMFFPWNPKVRYWMATTASGHGWGCPGWAVREYRFGGEDLFDDYDFGSEATLHNHCLSNEDICHKATAFFQQLLAYAHRRGVRVALGVELSGDPKEQEFILDNYPDLDYVLMYAGEWGGARGFNAAFYEALKRRTRIRIGLSGWGLNGNLAAFPPDLIAAPISAYSAGCVDGAQYGKREYWGCPWMERDGDRNLLKKHASSQHWYPYSINLSSSIVAYKDAAPNMVGWQTLTWRIADAIAPKLSWMAKSPWGPPPGSAWGHVGGASAALAAPVKSGSSFPVALTSYRHGDFGYKFDVPSGEIFSMYKYSVRLYFAEPRDILKKERTFNVVVNGNPVLKEYDIVARAGEARRVVEVAIPGIVCPLGILSVDFTGVAGEALVNAIAVDREGGGWGVKVNCGGGAENGFLADVAYGANSYRAYREYAARCYGAAAAESITAIINQNEPLAIGGGEAEGTPPLGDNPDPAGNILKADAQLATIDRCMALTKDRGHKERLRLLRTRIWSTRCYNAITAVDKNDAKVWDLADSFRDRVNDISTLGNLASFQNRYVKKYFTGNGRPNRLKATDPDTASPRVVVISPPTSSMLGQGVDVEARIIANRQQACLSATLHYRQPGANAWEELKMERRCRAIFGCRIPGNVIADLGMEYYVAASDGTNSGYFPVTAPTELPASLVFESQPATAVPPAPGMLPLNGNAIVWEAVGGQCLLYRIYRSTTPDFAPSIANYLCFVARGKTSFIDSENDYADQPKRGVYYYRVTAVDKAGNESAATPALTVEY